MKLTQKQIKQIKDNWEWAIDEHVYHDTYGEEDLHGVDWSGFGDWIVAQKCFEWDTTPWLRDPEEGYGPKRFVDFACYGGTECRSYYRAFGDAYKAIRKSFFAKEEEKILGSAALREATRVDDEHGMMCNYNAHLFASALNAVCRFYDRREWSKEVA